MPIALVTTAFAAPAIVRSDGRPTHAAARATERAFRCESTDWQLVRLEESGASWSVTLCAERQTITVRRVGEAWGFLTDAGLRVRAPEELGCPDLSYTLVDPGTRRASGCGVEATYRDGGGAGWVREESEPEPVAFVDALEPLVLADEPTLGDPAAPFVVVDYTDFGCPHCAAASAAVRELVVDPRVQVRMRFFPLDAACNPAARGGRPEVCEAAYAALCAQRQGRYWEYAGQLYAHQAELGEALFLRTADELRLDPGAFAACRADPAVRDHVARDVQSANAQRIAGTPTRFVLGLRGDAWVQICTTPAEIGAKVRAAEAGEVLGPATAATCWE